MITGAFDVFCGEQQVDARRDGLVIFEHIGEHFADGGVIELIEFLIAFPDGEGFLGIALAIGVEGVFDLFERALAHMAEAAIERARQRERDFAAALGDVFSNVADAFKVGRDFERGDGFAQVARHRLATGEQLDDVVIDGDIEVVDIFIVLDNFFGLSGVGVLHDFEGFGHLGFREAAHLEDEVGQLGEVFIEGVNGMSAGHDGLLNLSETSGDVILGALVLRLGEYIFCGSLLDENTEVEEGGSLRCARGLLHGVSDDDDRIEVAQFVDELFDMGGGDRVERGAGFIHQYDIGADGDGARDAQPLLLPARK